MARIWCAGDPILVSLGEERYFSSTLLSSPLTAAITKDRLTTEKHTHSFNDCFTDTEFLRKFPPQGNEDLKKQLNLGIFKVGLMKSGELWEKWCRTEKGIG